MKTLSKILLTVWLLGAVDANAELKKILLNFPAQQIPKPIKGFQLKADEVITVKTITTSGVFHGIAIVDYGDGFIVNYNLLDSNRSTLKNYIYRPVYNLVIVGPAEINFQYSYQNDTVFNAVFTYDLQKTTTSASSPSLPSSNTVVIPTDASGPVEIVMESSKDLVNWTRAEPGTYGTDTPKRFFRIRAVVKP